MNENLKWHLLGVDPGTNVLGYAVLEICGEKVHVADIGVVSMKGRRNAHDKLRHIFEQLQLVIRRHRPREMAIEAPFYGKNVQSMLKLGRAQGVAIAAAITAGLAITEYSPKKIKLAVTGNGNASKEQVAAMLQHQLGIDLSAQQLDATDALATALCHFYQNKFKPGQGPSYKSWEAFLKANPDRLR